MYCLERSKFAVCCYGEERAMKRRYIVFDLADEPRDHGISRLSLIGRLVGCCYNEW